MGQVATPATRVDVILTSVDRLQATNAGGGIPPAVQHIILLGAAAGANLSVNNVIALGAGAFDAGMANTDAAGTIAIGVNALSSNVAAGHFGFNGPSIVIGQNALQNATEVGSSVVIGSGAYSTTGAGALGSQFSANVVIGHNIGAASNDSTQGSSENVLIGYGIGSTQAGFRATTTVIIGASACLNSSSTSVQTSVVIGARASQSYSPIGCIIIGYTAAQTKTGGDNDILIGRAIVSTTSTNSIAIGNAIDLSAADSSTLLGDTITWRGNRCIILGARAGAGDGPAIDDTFIVETNSAGTRRALFFADMNSGNLVFGKSTPATDRDTRGTNTWKIVNGTRGAGNPVGGGFFYVTAGALHYVGSAGTDTPLAPA